MNLTINKSETAHLHDGRFKPYKKYRNKELGRYYIDISSVAIRKQHKMRYMYIKRGVKLDIDFVCLVDTKEQKGYYRFIPHKNSRDIINDFVNKTRVDKTQIYHDKSFLFGFGISYCGVSLRTQQHKQKIEHIFSFKRWVYREFKRGTIQNARDLFKIYRKYLNKRGLKEI